MSSANRRKFRLVDNNAITQVLETVLAMKASILEIGSNIEENVDTESIVLNNVPIGELYDILVVFESMYNKLVEEMLLQNGYPKSSKTLH